MGKCNIIILQEYNIKLLFKSILYFYKFNVTKYIIYLHSTTTTIYIYIYICMYDELNLIKGLNYNIILYKWRRFN